MRSNERFKQETWKIIDDIKENLIKKLHKKQQKSFKPGKSMRKNVHYGI